MKGTIVVCNSEKIRTLNGLPDCYHPIDAVLSSDTVTVTAEKDSAESCIAIFDAIDAAEKLHCFVDDLTVIEWDNCLRDSDGDAPCFNDIHGYHVKCDYELTTRVVDDFGDLY